MDQTRNIDRTKPILDQIIEVLDARYYAEGNQADRGLMDSVLGSRFQHHKKVALAITSLLSDHYFKHPEELMEYVED